MLNKEKCRNLINSDFYSDILAKKDSNFLIEKHILHNIPFYFKNDMDLFFDIKKKISHKYNISITNIYLVGSGQLGFSLNPEKNYYDFRYEETNDYPKASDLDFAIISSELFNAIWDELCGFRLGDFSYNDKERSEFRDFEKYLFKGWIRPDLFPFDFPMKKEWFEFFKSLNPLVNRQVTCGVFRNEISFLKQYKRSINELIKLIQTEKLL